MKNAGNVALMPKNPIWKNVLSLVGCVWTCCRKVKMRRLLEQLCSIKFYVTLIKIAIKILLCHGPELRTGIKCTRIAEKKLKMMTAMDDITQGENLVKVRDFLSTDSRLSIRLLLQELILPKKNVQRYWQTTWRWGKCIIANLQAKLGFQWLFLVTASKKCGKEVSSQCTKMWIKFFILRVVSIVFGHELVLGVAELFWSDF